MQEEEENADAAHEWPARPTIGQPFVVSTARLERDVGGERKADSRHVRRRPAGNACSFILPRPDMVARMDSGYFRVLPRLHNDD